MNLKAVDDVIKIIVVEFIISLRLAERGFVFPDPNRRPLCRPQPECSSKAYRTVNVRTIAKGQKETKREKRVKTTLAQLY